MHTSAAVNVDFLFGGGEMGERIRSFDWSQTPLGHPQGWEQSLKTCVRIILTSAQPMFVWWGPERINIYNDAYAQIMANKHPSGLGARAEDVWKEIWDSLLSRIESTERNEGTYDNSFFFIMERKDYQEEVYVSFSYSPAPGDDGSIKGLFCVCTETTDQIITDRQFRTLRKLSDKAITSKTIDEVYIASAEALSRNNKDLPFAIIYKISAEKLARPVAYAGISMDRQIFPDLIEILNPTDITGDFCKAYTTKKILIAENKGRIRNLPKGAWEIAPSHFIYIPILIPGEDYPVAILLAGMNPYRKYDDLYSHFVFTLKDHIAIAINNVMSYEQERKKAEALAEIDKAKTVFFSNISHEFRTPLTLMLGPLHDAMLDPKTIPANHGRLEIVHRNALRMQRLVNNLLDFSRIEAGRIKAEYEPVNLSAFTIDLASSFRSLIEKEGIQFVVDCPTITSNVWVDKDLWEKIVLNLLSNAFKFTWKGQILVRIVEVSGWAKLFIKDTGIGIPANEQGRIFERFHRVQNVNGRTIEGTGIGLALVSELVKLHDGSITVESKEGTGTTFVVSIPFKNSKVKSTVTKLPGSFSSREVSTELYLQEASLWKGSEEFLPAKAKNGHEKKYILVADDNADMRHYLSKMLSEEYDVKAVADGTAALRSIQDRKPHLVISDIMMPGLDGFELLEAIKGNESTKSVQVILLSARAGEEAINEGLTRGADAYLVKPFSARQLKTLVQNKILIKESRDKVDESEKQLHRFFRKAPFSLSLLEGENFNFRLVNEKSAQLLTIPESELLGKSLFEVAPELNEQEVGDILKNVYNTGKSFTGKEYPATFKRNGELTTSYFDFAFEPMLDDQGSVRGVVTLLIEVTDYVLARRKVEESEERFRTMASEAPLLVWETDDKLQTTFLNRTGLEYFNVDDKLRIEDLSWKKYIHPDDLERVLAIMEEASAKHEPYVLEMRLKNGSSGKYRWFLDQGVPRYQGNKFVGFIGTSLDIQERKEGEVLLEKRVIERTLQIAEKNEELQQTEHLLELKNQELEQIIMMLRNQQLKDQQKDNFIQMASHELKTPLTSIKAYAQLLAGTYTNSSDAFLKSGLNKVDQQVDKMTKLVGDFLNLTKIESGKLSIETERLDIDQLVSEVASDLQMVFGTFKIRYNEGSEVYVMADRERISQVLINFINNAVKYSPASEPIEITIQSDRDWVTVSVSDKGIGVAEEEQERIFQRFYRSRHNNENYSGFGIGLYISSEIIRKHDGRIGVNSEPGKGATFYFQLPKDQIMNNGKKGHDIR